MDQPILENSIASNSDAQLVEGGWIIAEPKVFTLNLGRNNYTHHTSGPVGQTLSVSKNKSKKYDLSLNLGTSYQTSFQLGW